MLQGIFTSSLIWIQSLNKDPSREPRPLGCDSVIGERRIVAISSVECPPAPPGLARTFVMPDGKYSPRSACLPACRNFPINHPGSVAACKLPACCEGVCVCVWARAAINRWWHLINGSWGTTRRLVFTAAADLLNSPECSRKIENVFEGSDSALVM